MGWKGALRSIQAASREAERDSRRRQRELDRQQREYDKLQELEQAAYEVDAFENHIEQLLSIHRESSHPVDWKSIVTSKPPTEPVQSGNQEQEARHKLDTYKPGVTDKLFKRAEKKQQRLATAIDEVKQADEDEYRHNLSEYKKEQEEWEAEQSLASRVLAGESDAYIDAINELNLFSEISDLGSSVRFETSGNGILAVEINVHGEDVVPTESKRLLQSGRLSIKQMPKGQFYEIYQDYVCSSVLRITNELFSLLPLDAVVVTAVDNMLNSKTGHLEDQPILSVAIPRATFEKLNLDPIDPSDSMQNFVHNMIFKKTKGFVAVERGNQWGQTRLIFRWRCNSFPLHYL